MSANESAGAAENQVAIAGGLAVTSAIVCFTAKGGDQAWPIGQGWRWMFGKGIAPAVFLGLLLLPIPESSRCSKK